MSERDPAPEGKAPGESWASPREERLRSLYRAAYDPVSPSEALRRRVEAVTAQPQAARRRFRAWWPLLPGERRIAAAAAIVLVAGSVILGIGTTLIDRSQEPRRIAVVRPDPSLPSHTPEHGEGQEQRPGDSIRVERAGPGRAQPGVALPRRFPYPIGPTGQPGAVVSRPPGSGVWTKSDSLDEGSTDLLHLNGGHVASAPPFVPELPLPSPPLPSLPLQEYKPGSVLLDDLLYLNPIRLAAAADSGLAAAARDYAAEAPATDARLQQKVVVHASDLRIADLLNRLSRATEVTMVARPEVAEEKVSVWADDRPLMDMMRDLRHLYGYYWSRSKQGETYVYSLWQDAQSRAREEAELQRLVMEEQQQFETNIWKRVRAVNASQEELRRLGQGQPYFIAQMLHPVVRNGYRLFGALSPDQQALLTRGQTPSLGNPAGMVMDIIGPPDERYPPHPWNTARRTPKGDVVTLQWHEMTPEQRQALEAIIRGAAAQKRKEAAHDPQRQGAAGVNRFASAMDGADLATARVSLFRCGDPLWQGLHLRVDVQSGGEPWGLYSNIAIPSGSEKSYDESLRKGEFQVWAGAQEEVKLLLGAGLETGVTKTAGAKAAPAAGQEPDPILDALLSFTWVLPLREGAYSLGGEEVLAALHREIGRPLILNGWPRWIEQKRSEGPRFRWEKRPVRELLQRFFPGWEIQTYEGAIFLKKPESLRDRLYRVPATVERFLQEHTGPLTMEDMALLARSLSPWQVTRLSPLLPLAAMDQILAVQELLRLYGELAPAQRKALEQGLSFSALTPPQQALFLQFAQRHRPYVEPWRFQGGALRLTLGPVPENDDRSEKEARPTARSVFHVRLGDADSPTFPLDLHSPQERRWRRPLSSLVGQPFPFPTRVAWSRGPHDDGPTAWEPALADPRLRKKPLVIAITWPYAEPYIGRQPPPDPVAWSTALAHRLRDAGITVVHIAMEAKEAAASKPAPRDPPHLIRLIEPGAEDGHPFRPRPEGGFIMEAPSVIVVDGSEVVRSVFGGQSAWDVAAIERAARGVAPGPRH